MPKHNEVLEANLLYLLIANPELLDVAEIEPTDFYQNYAQDIFVVARRMRENGDEVNLTNVCIEADKEGINTSKLRADISDETVLPSNFAQYVRTLKELSVTRQIDDVVGEGESPATMIEKIKQLQSKLEVAEVQDVEEAFQDYMLEYEERKNRENGVGIITGFDELDMKAPMEPGMLVTLAARSSIGKSAFALTVARNAAMYNQNILFISAEMSVPRLLDRLLAMLSGVDAYKFRTSKADASINAVKNDIANLKKKLRFVYLPYASSEEVCRLIAKENAKRKVDLVIVDYLQYLRDRKGKNDNEATRVGNMTRNFKAIAGGCDCAVMALSQVNRQAMNNEEGMPALHQLRDSGAIEQDSDIVLILNRENRDDEHGRICVAKNRSGEAEFSVDLMFRPETTQYTQRAEAKRVEYVKQDSIEGIDSTRYD